MLKPLLILLAVLCTAGCMLGAFAALTGQRRRAHLANAAVLGLCTAGSTLALACLAAARNDARWAWFWPAWLLSTASAAVLIYLWLVFRIF